MDSSGFSISQGASRFVDAEPLGESGGTCVCSRVKRYGKWLFVKQLKPELATDPRHVAALRKEFETGYALDHPSLARYVELGDDYLLMDYVDGMPLDRFAHENRAFFRQRDKTERLVLQLLDAVRYLHHHQVLHLDLKPSNILVTHIGHDVKLVDFGFCYTDTFADTAGLSEQWAAPEQLNGGTVDERTDIFALGRILQSLPLPKSYRHIANRCTVTEPQKRYQSVDQIIGAYKSLKRRWLVVLSVAAVMMTGIAVALWQYSKTEPASTTIAGDGAQTSTTAVAESEVQTTLPSVTDVVTDVSSSPSPLPDTEEGNPISSVPAETSSPVSETSPTPSTSSTPSTSHNITATLPTVSATSHTPSTSPTISATSPTISTSQSSAKAVVPEPAQTPDTQPVRGKTMKLRRYFQEAFKPAYSKHLAHWEKTDYAALKEIGAWEEKFSKDIIGFESAVRPVLMSAYKEFEGKYSKNTIYDEWHQTVLYYKYPLLWRQERQLPQLPSHQIFYDTVRFEYYKFDL